MQPPPYLQHALQLGLIWSSSPWMFFSSPVLFRRPTRGSGLDSLLLNVSSEDEIPRDSEEQPCFQASIAAQTRTPLLPSHCKVTPSTARCFFFPAAFVAKRLDLIGVFFSFWKMTPRSCANVPFKWLNMQLACFRKEPPERSVDLSRGSDRRCGFSRRSRQQNAIFI